MEYNEDHINTIEVLEDSDLEFNLYYYISDCMAMILNVGDNMNASFFKDYEWAHRQMHEFISTYGWHQSPEKEIVQVFNDENPMIKRIFKLTGFSLYSYKVRDRRPYPHHEIFLIFRKYENS